MLLIQLVRVCGEGERLSSSARLAREQVVAALWLQASDGSVDRLGVGRVTDARFAPVGDVGECAREYFRGKRRAAHTGNNKVGNARGGTSDR